jgi:hypothetical protein
MREIFQRKIGDIGRSTALRVGTTPGDGTKGVVSGILRHLPGAQICSSDLSSIPAPGRPSTSVKPRRLQICKHLGQRGIPNLGMIPVETAPTVTVADYVEEPRWGCRPRSLEAIRDPFFCRGQPSPALPGDTPPRPATPRPRDTLPEIPSPRLPPRDYTPRHPLETPSARPYPERPPETPSARPYPETVPFSQRCV